MTDRTAPAIPISLPDRYDRLRIDAAVVYTAEPQRPVVEEGSVLIQGDVIAAVGTAEEVDRVEADLGLCAGRARRIDATDRMILPGLVNDHWHEVGALRVASGMGVDIDDRGTEASQYSRGGDMLAVSQFFASVPELQQMIPEALARLAALEAYVAQLRAGTTCVADFGSANRPDVLAQAILDTGIRGTVTAYAVDGVCKAGETSFQRIRDANEILAETEELLEQFGAHESGRLRAMPSVLVGFSASDELIRGAVALAGRYDTPVATHLAAMANERAFHLQLHGSRPVERWHRLGLLSDRIIAAHTAFADADELGWLQSAGVHVTHCPQRYGATGENTTTTTRQILSFLDAGDRVSLSTDGDALPLGFMPEAMRMAWLAYNEAAGDPSTVTPTRALSMATWAGARALRWDAEIGSLAAGKKADLVTVPVADFRYTGVRRRLQSYLAMGSSADIDMTVVDGRILVEDRAATFVDERQLNDAFLAAAGDFAQAMAAAH